MGNPYLELTREFNRGRLRALLSSGQAVVVHRLAMMSKDGDWVVREDDDATGHLLAVLAARGAHYRFGAPLDRRWLAGGWSSHFEFALATLRLRIDFVSRPPRLDAEQLAGLWRAAEASGSEVVGLVPLAAMKLTRREKDYAVVGELARRMADPRARLLYSRSARDLAQLASAHPELTAELSTVRPLLAEVAEGRERLEAELDRERRALMRADEARVARYLRAARQWEALWPELARELGSLPLEEAHRTMVERASDLLPFAPAEEARA
jgi:hypothetical protein